MNPNEFLMEVMGEYGREIENLWDKLPGGMFNPLESIALYTLIRHTRPQHILEIGSLLGKSSALIEQAVEYNETGKFTTCDLESRSKITKRNLDKLFPDNKIEYLSGPIQGHLEDIEGVDFLFIDGPHEAAFMQWCVDNIVSKMKQGNFVLIHDINLSYDWNYRATPGCETECLLKLAVDNKLPLQKVVWLEDWCLNHNLKYLRNSMSEDFPIIGKWGILNPPEANSLSIWLKKDLNVQDKHTDSNK